MKRGFFMYARTIIYKIYAIAILALSVLSALFSVIFVVPAVSLAGTYFPFVSQITVAIQIVIVLCAIICVFFSYMEFSSMYCFTDMIDYERSDSIYPMSRRFFVLPAAGYRVFGLIMFIINLVSNIICALFIIITNSIQAQCFICLPVIPLAINIAVCVIYYINYYARYKAIGDLLELVTSMEVNEPIKQKLKENKPGMLRGYCIFLAAVCVIVAIAVAVALFFVFEPLSKLIGFSAAIGVTVGIIISTLLTLLCVGIMGCYVDNIAKMLEHYQIKYHLIEMKK